LHPVEKLYTADGNGNTHVGNAITTLSTEGKPSGTQTAQAIETKPEEQKTTSQVERPVGPSTPEIEAEVKAQKEAIGEAYNNEREYAGLDDDVINFMEVVGKGELPRGYTLGSTLLKDALKSLGIKLDLSGYKNTTPTAEEQTAVIKEIAEAIKNKRQILREWSALTEDQRNIFLANLVDNTPLQRANAFKALLAYTNKIREVQNKPRELKASPDAAAYEDNRKVYNKRKIQLPPWDKLTDAQRKLFADVLVKELNKTRKAKGKPALGRLEAIKESDVNHHDTAFKAVWEALKADGYVAKVGSTWQENTSRQLKEQEGVAYATAQQEISSKLEIERAKKEKAEAEAKAEPTEADFGRGEKPLSSEQAGYPSGKVETPNSEPKKPSPFVDKTIIEQLFAGNLMGVLQGLRSKGGAKNKIIKGLAQRLYELKLNTKIEYVDSLPDGDLAIYDPNTDTIKITQDGLTESTIIHEVVHAATHSVIAKYRAGGKGLTDAQKNAVKSLEDLMKQAKENLGEQYPNAFKSLDEFVSYALTDVSFQQNLADIGWSVYPGARAFLGVAHTNFLDIEAGTKPTGAIPIKKNLWSKFLLDIVEAIGLSNWIFRIQVSKDVFKGGNENAVQSNLLIETLGAFDQILSVPIPVEGGTAPVLPAKGQKAPKQTTTTAPSKVDSPPTTILFGDGDTTGLPLAGDQNKKTIIEQVTSKGFYDKIVRNFQNAAAPIKNVEEFFAKLGKITTIGDKINNVFTQISLSGGRAWWNYTRSVSPTADAVSRAIENFAETSNIGVQEALRVLHGYTYVIHEPERRRVKYIKTVPLNDTDKLITINGVGYTPEAVRTAILESLASPSKDNATAISDAEKLRKTLDAIVDDKTNWAKFTGNKKPVPTTPEMFDISTDKYNVVGNYSKKELADLKAFYENPKAKYNLAKIKAVMVEVNKLQEISKQLNSEANYWSQAVNKVAAFYGYKNYVPFKGHPNIRKSDEDLDYGNSKRLGADLTDKQSPFYGRQSDSENPILQSLADASRAALRLGRKQLTLSIKNAVNDKIIDGSAKVNIPFEDRYLDSDALKAAQGETKILHYEEDGSITVITLTSSLQREAIRRTYEESNPLLEKANAVTSLIGQTHTRYSLPFAPMNFVRDALTNAFTLGAKFGPMKSMQLITEVAKLASTKMYSSAQISYYLANNKIAELDALEKSDKSGYVKDAIEYLKAGGRVSYIQGLAARGQLAEISKEVGRSGILKGKDQVEKVFDYWTDTFELTSRIATYRVLKQTYLAENKQTKMSAADALEDAQQRATVGAKNLANFEQVGRYGKIAGAMFMFFRPAATGAVQAIEAVTPYFGFNEETFTAKATAAGATKAEIAAAVAKAKKQTGTTRQMVNGLLGFGAFTYLAAFMMADDDEQGRNRVSTDDSARWSRYARFFIPGMETPFQIPWGFGLGSFAATGAQVMSAAMGNSSVKEMLSNTVQLGLDSFLPIPISRISLLEDPAAWAMDSALPSAMRPFLEYVMNKDALGREIYNNRQTRGGDAYTGGDNIPESYKLAARTLFDVTEGAVDVSPNTLYFWASNYIDGLAKLGSTAVGLGLTAAGQKDFNPKTDTILFDSFFGAPSNVDSKQFSNVENQIKNLERRLNTLKQDPPLYASFVAENPTSQFIVDFYNKEVGGNLNQIRKLMNDIRVMRDISPKERTDMLKNLLPASNMVKRNLIEVFKQVGEITP
jgi:hypothetical protein